MAAVAQELVPLLGRVVAPAPLGVVAVAEPAPCQGGVTLRQGGLAHGDFKGLNAYKYLYIW